MCYRQEGKAYVKNVICLQLRQHYIHSQVEGDDVFPTLRANHKKLQYEKQRRASIVTTNASNGTWRDKKNTIAIVALCHILSCAKAPSVSCLNSIPSKALSCVMRTPLPMPNKAAKNSKYRVPSNPVGMLKFSRSKINTTDWTQAPKDTIAAIDGRPEVRRPAAREQIPSKAPYAASILPTPETPIAGVTTYLVNSAQTNACCRPEYVIRGMINNIFTSNNALVSDLQRDLRDECSPAPPPSPECSHFPLLLLSLRLRKKNISIAPKVITKRSTANNEVLPLVLPSFPSLSRANVIRLPINWWRAYTAQNSPLKLPITAPSCKLLSLA
uniref:Uncharacterized protein n=1 Tax=Lotus japonicus TaxID=34305 RepID=I3SK11_LOTJA|nr:unknown [Lotus japonicus]